MEKQINVTELSFGGISHPDSEQIISGLDASNVPFHSIDQNNWPQFSYNAKVSFRIAYSDINKEIYIQFNVIEDDIKAEFGEDKGSPYKDSCVEFFSIPGNDGIYYNLEMNCIGKGTLAGGAERINRTRYDNDILNLIRRYPSLGYEAFKTRTLSDNGNMQHQWSLVLAIPYDVFTLSNIESLKNKTIKGNFYKCGDDMPTKHYLSWNPIETPKPNFHTPDYFGTLIFE